MGKCMDFFSNVIKPRKVGSPILLRKVRILTLRKTIPEFSVQSNNRDKIKIIQYGDQLLTISFYFVLFFDRSYNIFPSYSKRILCLESKAIEL